MFGTIIKEREIKETVNSALNAYAALLNIFEKFSKMCCDVFKVQGFNGTIKCVDSKKHVFSIMGFLITVSFRPVSDESGKISGVIIFKHETTELCRILFDISGNVLEQTCSNNSLVSLNDADGFNSMIYHMIHKFINSEIMKDK